MVEKQWFLKDKRIPYSVLPAKAQNTLSHLDIQSEIVVSDNGSTVNSVVIVQSGITSICYDISNIRCKFTTPSLKFLLVHQHDMNYEPEDQILHVEIPWLILLL